ncbi:glycoside hydrolase family 3 N-terminal domain-containing protein [Actinoplanes sp. N902-109]|uniref:glycoside hydrolase family 3 N-terminal domain-containing protein n=1 Tax=Actinoplanes sp. (strain N902-109) TaxID=649831 RepID=UPI00032959D5|nr:glycoside hydrolase family 3 N-terminal domain-containing protein [Actinoplanes sp. N902-109]AGL20530.1 glycoside hydrolase family 3 domain-containing protein [Actinoplanes sp. N902-109]
MTIDPGLRRLALGSILAAFPGPVLPDRVTALLADGLAGVTLFGTNVVDRCQVAALTAAISAVRPQPLIAIDEEGGDVTRLWHRTGSPYPGNAALGAVDDPDLTRSVHAAIGSELAGLGITLNLAPVADVNTEADNPIIGTRAFGSAPALVARHTAAAVEGLQSTGVAACAKHFPGHGATRTDSHLGLPTIDAAAGVLRSRDLPPFAAAVAAGAAAVMTAHIRIPALTGALPATFSSAVLRDLLRHEYGHRGAIVTDALEMRGAIGAAGSVGRAAVLALAAGADVLCLGARVSTALVAEVLTEIAGAVADGRLSADRLSDAADRTATLAARTLAPVATDPALGLAAARRALRIEGTVSGFADAVVIRLHPGHPIASGPVPWGDFGSAVPLAAADLSIADLLERAGQRPLVLAGRRLHHTGVTRELIDSVAARHTVAVVEMGWPASWRPAAARAFVTTFGAGAANGQAAAEALGLTSGLHPRS